MHKIKVILLIVSIIFLCGTMGVLCLLNQSTNQNESRTNSYEATVTNISIVNIGRDVYAEIETKEYEANLYISVNICKNIDMKNIQKLKKGQKIKFRIESQKSELLDEFDFVDIVSLKTETTDIFSLEDYNKYMGNLSYPARTIVIIECIILAVVIIKSFLQIIKRNKA